MTRIRYIKGEEGIYRSIKTFYHPENGARYNVILDTGRHEWKIIDDESEVVVITGNHSSTPVMKQHVKTALCSLGILFDNETRILRVKP